VQWYWGSGYVGWAPLGWYGAVPWAHFVFVQERDFNCRHVHQVVVHRPRHQYDQLFRERRLEPRPPPHDHIRRVSHDPIVRVPERQPPSTLAPAPGRGGAGRLGDPPRATTPLPPRPDAPRGFTTRPLPPDPRAPSRGGVSPQLEPAPAPAPAPLRPEPGVPARGQNGRPWQGTAPVAVDRPPGRPCRRRRRPQQPMPRSPFEQPGGGFLQRPVPAPAPVMPRPQGTGQRPGFMDGGQGSAPGAAPGWQRLR
jgi:hypothetical protein